MSVWPYPIKAVIFDCDGTILDTTKIYFNANEIVVGQSFPIDLQKRCNGRGENEVSKSIVEYFKLPMTPKEFLKLRNVILDKTLPDCKVIPHVDEIINKLKGMGLKLAVATSASRHFHDLKTMNHEKLFSLFDYDVCGNEVNEAKPNPEVFQVAAQKLGDFKPENVLVFEDAIAGIKAANDAKMPVVVYHENDTSFNENLKEIGAKPTVVIDNYDNFDYSLFKWE